MRTATKFVEPLTEWQCLRLKEIHKTDPLWRRRMRAQAILLSEKGFAINQLADIFEVDRDTVSLWLDWWAEYEFDGLADDPRSGRPPILTDDTQKKRRSN